MVEIAQSITSRAFQAGRRSLEQAIEAAVSQALAEDLGSGDITSIATVPSDKQVKAEIWFKQTAVLAGIPVFAAVLTQVDPRISVHFTRSDGELIEAPAIVGTMEGNARSLLAAERVGLNFLQRLSGVATATRRFVELAKPANISILDTRKTTPGLRALERYAVRIGGGVNHRFCLDDAILIKDNHLRLAGGVTEALRRTRASRPGEPVEVEVTNLDELREALAESADAVLLDNMSPESIKEALALIAGRCFVEISGGITLSNIHSYLIAGVNAISIGAITHSAASVDISLESEA